MESLSCPPFCEAGCTLVHDKLLLALVNCPDNDLPAEYQEKLRNLIQKKQGKKWTLSDPIDDTNPDYRYPVVLWACAIGKPVLVKWLLSNGFENTTQDSETGDNGLHRSILCLQKSSRSWREALGKFKDLLPLFEDCLLLSDNVGCLPLHIACEMFTDDKYCVDFYKECAQAMVELAVNKGQDLVSQLVNSQTDNGLTVLHILASKDESFKLVKLLVELGKPNLHLRDCQGMTCLGVAINSGLMKISQLLSKHLTSEINSDKAENPFGLEVSNVQPTDQVQTHLKMTETLNAENTAIRLPGDSQKVKIDRCVGRKSPRGSVKRKLADDEFQADETVTPDRKALKSITNVFTGIKDNTDCIKNSKKRLKTDPYKDKNNNMDCNKGTDSSAKTSNHDCDSIKSSFNIFEEAKMLAEKRERIRAETALKNKVVWSRYIQLCEKDLPYSQTMLLSMTATQLCDVFAVNPGIREKLGDYLEMLSEDERTQIPETVLDLIKMDPAEEILKDLIAKDVQKNLERESEIKRGIDTLELVYSDDKVKFPNKIKGLISFREGENFHQVKDQDSSYQGIDYSWSEYSEQDADQKGDPGQINNFKEEELPDNDQSPDQVLDLGKSTDQIQAPDQETLKSLVQALNKEKVLVQAENFAQEDSSVRVTNFKETKNGEKNERPEQGKDFLETECSEDVNSSDMETDYHADMNFETVGIRKRNSISDVTDSEAYIVKEPEEPVEQDVSFETVLNVNTNHRTEESNRIPKKAVQIPDGAGVSEQDEKESESRISDQRGTLNRTKTSIEDATVMVKDESTLTLVGSDMETMLNSAATADAGNENVCPSKPSVTAAVPRIAGKEHGEKLATATSESTSPASSVKKTISVSKSGTDPEELDRCKTVLDALGPAIHTKATSGKKQELNRNSLEEYLSLSSTKAILRNSLFRDRDKCNELLKETQKQLEDTVQEGKKLQNSNDQLDVDVNKHIAEVNKYMVEVNKLVTEVNKPMVDVTQPMDEFNKHIEAVNKHMEEVKKLRSVQIEKKTLQEGLQAQADSLNLQIEEIKTKLQTFENALIELDK